MSGSPGQGGGARGEVGGGVWSHQVTAEQASRMRACRRSTQREREGRAGGRRIEDGGTLVWWCRVDHVWRSRLTKSDLFISRRIKSWKFIRKRLKTSLQCGNLSCCVRSLWHNWLIWVIHQTNVKRFAGFSSSNVRMLLLFCFYSCKVNFLWNMLENLN